MIDAPWFGAAVIWGGVGAGLVLTLAGLVMVARGAMRLSDRLAVERELPLFAQIDDVQAKFASVEARINEFPQLIERTRSALLALRDSRLQVRALGETLSFAAQLARAIFRR